MRIEKILCDWCKGVVDENSMVYVGLYDSSKTQINQENHLCRNCSKKLFNIVEQRPKFVQQQNNPFHSLPSSR